MVVWEYGVHLATRHVLRETVMLWQIEHFYVEVFYDGLENEINKIRSFLSIAPLEPYLKQIDLPQLL